MELRGSFTYSQELATEPYPEPDKSVHLYCLYHWNFLCV